MQPPRHNPEWWCIHLGHDAQAHTPSSSTESFNRLTQVFFRFTPDIVQGKNRIFLEMSRTKQFFSLNGFIQRARVLGSREGIDSSHWRFGMGPTLAHAWVQTRWRTQEFRQLPLDAYFDFIHPLTHLELNRSMRERIALFQSLGMTHLESLFSVPKESWLVRFGDEFHQFLESVDDSTRKPWTRFLPTSDLSETTRWNADEIVIDAESLIFKIKPIIDRLCEQLYGLRRALKKMEVTLKLERNVPDRVLELHFAFPQTSRTLLLKLLREKISRTMEREPLTDPIVEVEIKVLESVKREHESERFAFSTKDEEESGRNERWLELISYLSLKLEAPAQVFQVETQAHHLPERSWKRVLLTPTETAQSQARVDSLAHLYATRPVKLLSEPLPIFRIGHFLKREQTLWTISEFTQIEHLEGYDWDVEDTQGFDRTYYKVKVKNSAGITQFWWIFKDELSGGLKLHGIY